MNDKQLIESYLRGNKTAFEVLIKQYLKFIYNFAYRYVNSASDAEDLTQETFVKVWKNLKRFDRNKGFKTWIFKIARNTIIDFLRKKKKITIVELEDDQIQDTAPTQIELFEKIDAANTFKFALGQLPKKYRNVLLLYYNDHLNFREIAEVLDKPLNTIKSRHRRAIAMLKMHQNALSIRIN